MESAMASNGDQVEIKPPPPVVAIALLGAGIGLHLAFPAPIFASRWPGLAIGAVLLSFGIALNFLAIRTLRRARTDVTFRKPVSLIVRHGAYGRSRNPIYLSGLLQFAGFALLVNTWWLVALWPALVLYLRFAVIAREERYLERRFGDEFRAYRSSVRRWI